MHCAAVGEWICEKSAVPWTTSGIRHRRPSPAANRDTIPLIQVRTISSNAECPDADVFLSAMLPQLRNLQSVRAMLRAPCIAAPIDTRRPGISRPSARAPLNSPISCDRSGAATGADPVRTALHSTCDLEPPAQDRTDVLTGAPALLRRGLPGCREKTRQW